MDAKTLRDAMPGLTLARAQQLVAGCNESMLAGQINTVKRAAMFLAQIGHESVSLLYKEEIGRGAGHPYPPYYGRGFIQLTWGYNYTAFGAWCKARGLVNDSSVFLHNPSLVEQDRWAWLSAVFFWSTHNLNVPSDAGDVLRATRIINGGTNGLENRKDRYYACLQLGNRILPAPPKPVGGLSVSDVNTILAALKALDARVAAVENLVSMAIRGDLAPAGKDEWTGAATDKHRGNLINIKSDTEAIRKKLGA